MDQIIPNKPSHLSDQEWLFILERDKRQCANYAQCHALGKNGFCDSHLDVDHEHPRDLGGDDSFVNLRLLCRSHNRGRAVKAIEKWAEPNYWDTDITPAKLRETQRIASIDPIEVLWKEIEEYEKANWPQTFRNKLLGGVITLLPGATGTGKTIILQAVLFTINKRIGLNRPRARKVLWLSTDNQLRDLCKEELSEEIVAHGIALRKPNVEIAKSFSQLEKGSQKADIVVACPQMLWTLENDKKNFRSENEQRAVLAQFDVIVFDEADWANERVREISQKATHAMQFSLTASPPLHEFAYAKEDKEIAKKFIQRFCIIRQDAVADYRRAVELDGCLKLFESEINAARHDSYHVIDAGIEREIKEQMGPEHSLFLSTILQAIVEQDRRETRMKKIVGKNYYSPHLMVRMESINAILLMEPQLQNAIDNLYKNEIIHNPGWSVCSVYGGNDRRKTKKGETGLSTKDGTGGWGHPFMLAKNNKGQATEESKRVLLMCQIGIRGINNWPVNAIVDCTTRTSIADLIQFVFGRPIRLPNHLSQWLDDTNLHEFVTAYTYIPTSLYEDEEKKKSLKLARDFVEGMLEHIEKTNFRTWEQILHGTIVTIEPAKINPTEPPLPNPEKYAVQQILSQHLINTGKLPLPTDTDNISDIVVPGLRNIFSNITPARLNSAIEYSKDLLNNPSYKRRETTADNTTNKYKEQPVYVGLRLQPKDVYPADELIRFVKNDPEYSEKWQLYEERINNSDALVIEPIARHLRSIQEFTYREPVRMCKLHNRGNGPKGALTEVGDELNYDLQTAKQLPDGGSGIVMKLTNAAAKILFGLTGEHDARNGGPMDHPAYHIAILGTYRKVIQRMARGMLIREGHIAGNIDQFADWEDE